jgi:hypothetical protein
MMIINTVTLKGSPGLLQQGMRSFSPGGMFKFCRSASEVPWRLECEQAVTVTIKAVHVKHEFETVSSYHGKSHSEDVVPHSGSQGNGACSRGQGTTCEFRAGTLGERGLGLAPWGVAKINIP